MIIRLTINDNDFTDKYLVKFAKNLDGKLLGLCDIICRSEDVTIDEKLNAHKDWDRTFHLLNPNCTTAKNITENDKEFICKQVKQCWINYITRSITKSDAKDDGLTYFIDHFECSVGYDFKDMWENGEVVYYFTTAQAVICQ